MYVCWRLVTALKRKKVTLDQICPVCKWSDYVQGTSDVSWSLFSGNMRIVTHIYQSGFKFHLITTNVTGHKPKEEG